MFCNLKFTHMFCIMLFVSAFGTQDLTKMDYDMSDPNFRIPLPVGEAKDIYIHYDLDPSMIEKEDGTFKNEQEMVEYLMTLTDIMNRDTFNAVNFNLVTSSFSINSEETHRGMMLQFRNEEVLPEGEAHIWIHITDLPASSIAYEFGLYDGAESSYVIAAAFNGGHFNHHHRSTVAHEIGVLFGLGSTHVLSLNFVDVEVNPDQCGGGPYGVDCSTKPTIGGSLMSFCGECPRHGGSSRSAKPLTSFHPYQAEKIQENYAHHGETLPLISRQKLRTFIPDEAKECAVEGEKCFCKGVVYYGPTISSDNPLIFGVEHVTDSVGCSSGADEAFADVFHGRSKSCYCHEGADLHDITYTPADVEFTNGGIGECKVACSDETCWEEYNNHGPLGYFTITGQPEWKCKQECLDRDECEAYNFMHGNCRLFQRQPSGTWKSEFFSESTCWVRPKSEDARYLTPSWQEGEIIISAEKTNDEPVTESTCDVGTSVAAQEKSGYSMYCGKTLAGSGATIVDVSSVSPCSGLCTLQQCFGFCEGIPECTGIEFGHGVCHKIISTLTGVILSDASVYFPVGVKSAVYIKDNDGSEAQGDEECPQEKPQTYSNCEPSGSVCYYDYECCERSAFCSFSSLAVCTEMGWIFAKQELRCPDGAEGEEDPSGSDHKGPNAQQYQNSGYEYVMLKNGEVCPNEASLIDNKDECYHAIYEVGQETKAEPWVGFMKSELKKPAGCSFDLLNGNVHFNTNFDNGVGLGESVMAPICKYRTFRRS